MPTTAIMWFRRDLRLRDLPALAAAARAERTVPVFVIDERLITKGRFPCPARCEFMLGSLRELDASLRERGGRLAIRSGRPEREIPKLAGELSASEVHFTRDATPWSRRRDARVIEALSGMGVQSLPREGACVVDDPSKILTGQGKPYTVFTPFARTWMREERRRVLAAPRSLTLPSTLRVGRLPRLSELGLELDHEPVFEPGEAAGRRAMASFLRSGIERYEERRDRPSGGSSRLSPYLRWGCVSALELDTKASERSGQGAEAYRNELAWRDFYAMVLMHFPQVVRHEYQERYRELPWKRRSRKFELWQRGETGYPLVDAGMRQLLAEGWMHNRVRMVVGSFLTKDLHMDWRHGERHFMEQLVDGDMAANNGGWQWIASVGTDAKPYFQRLFNPTRQQERFDPEGDYVRRWVPELADVPSDLLSEPWTMSEEQQREAGCVIGRDYPEPIVDHAEERRVAQERYRSVAR